MKRTICIAAISFLLGSAVAQQTSGQPPSTQPDQADRQNQMAQENQTKTQDQTAGKSGSTQMPEMKTQTYKGVLVDVSCGASAGGTTASMNSSASTPDTSASTANADQSMKPNAANRAANEQSCAVSSNSSQFGLKLDDGGRMMRFDLVGNQRAQDALKNYKKWSEAVSSGKPLHVKVSGAVNGDKLIVSSIH